MDDEFIHHEATKRARNIFAAPDSIGPTKLRIPKPGSSI
jgi:hypothetical protein